MEGAFELPSTGGTRNLWAGMVGALALLLAMGFQVAATRMLRRGSSASADGSAAQ
ncbi:LPXTG cell wall anchor domain-containing protein [Bifidobacterium gallicum]|uniref:LPXTG-motif cell wall anchor domain protein n=1 Tax=Bifidobacterium gallicum DSM 20093 = LMG 11596 TaxID=561180 RepID=D1NWH0_9BIFI|nr:LPXTG cell wall anchor domain-containing protein [Bifidobacterium gallicum]EFA22456.1 LPXTG-motif cell wall anchor domain protein [Bifidobacterium gallicum DSM 20093 = LMG 11596]